MTILRHIDLLDSYRYVNGDKLLPCITPYFPVTNEDPLNIAPPYRWNIPVDDPRWSEFFESLAALGLSEGKGYQTWLLRRYDHTDLANCEYVALRTGLYSEYSDLPPPTKGKLVVEKRLVEYADSYDFGQLVSRWILSDRARNSLAPLPNVAFADIDLFDPYEGDLNNWSGLPRPWSELVPPFKLPPPTYVAQIDNPHGLAYSSPDRFGDKTHAYAAATLQAAPFDIATISESRDPHLSFIHDALILSARAYALCYEAKLKAEYAPVVLT